MGALGAGKLVVHPTETVASLSGDPYSEAAVGAARRIKGYARRRPFLCLVQDLAAARALAADWPEAAARLAAEFWPGPLTLVVSAAGTAPGPVVEAGRIALRPGVDPVTRALLAAWGGPLFSTSANARGQGPARSVREAVESLAVRSGGSAIAVGLEIGDPARHPATEPCGPPSTIVDVTVSPPRIARAGAIPGSRLRVDHGQGGGELGRS